MNKTVFKTFLTQMASPQLSHRIEHKAGLPCAPFCNLIVAQPFEIWKFWNQHLFCLMGTFWYLESNWDFFFSFLFHIHRTFENFFSEIPLTNKMYPKTTNENHFQTCLIQGWPTIQLKNGAYALFYCLIVGQPLKVKYLSDT